MSGCRLTLTSCNGCTCVADSERRRGGGRSGRGRLARCGAAMPDPMDPAAGGQAAADASPSSDEAATSQYAQVSKPETEASTKSYRMISMPRTTHALCRRTSPSHAVISAEGPPMPSLTIGEVPNGTQPVSYANGRVVVYDIEYPWAVMLSTVVADDTMSNNGPVNAAGRRGPQR